VASSAKRRPRAARLLRTSLVALAVAGALAACASKKVAQAPEPPTLKSLANRQIAVAPDAGVQRSGESAARAYKDFLQAAPRDPHRREALRRLGDLEMDRIDGELANAEPVQPGGAGAPPAGTAAQAGAAAGAPAAASAGGAAAPAAAVDYRPAIARYQEFLKTYPNDPGNDRVLYQLARAQELSGELEVSLNTLTRLVRDYPQTRYRDEAEFRRGELLFTLRQYDRAEQAFATTMRSGEASPFYERSLYMHGWSLFKQARLEDGLASFFGVLDRKLAGKGDGELDGLPGLTRADRELVEDTFRVASLSLENLQGANTIATYITTPARREYEFRVYQQLGELYIKQDRTKDAADTFGAFAQKQPLHAQAPLMQARVIDIYQNGGFANQALEAKKRYVSHYGVSSEFKRANPAGWERAQPLVKTHLSELARHYHASAQKSRRTDDYQEAVRWYRAYLDSFPADPEAARNNFLLAELLYEDSRFAEASAEYEKAAYGYPAHDKSREAGYAALLAYAQQEKRAQGDALKKVQLAGVDSALRFAGRFPDDNRNGAVLTNASERLFALNDTQRAAQVAQQVLALQPPAAPAQRRVAWTVVAHTSFDRASFAEAERGYAEVLALTPANDKARAELVERQAAAIYKQGEQARAKNELREAVAHFTRVAGVAPASPVRATAQYDAAAALIALKDWDAATRTLEDFRQRYPKHPLQDEVSSKLAVAYVERGNWSAAAGEFERLAAANKDPQMARAGLWQAAEMYEKAGARAPAGKAYERYVAMYPAPLEAAVEARYRLAKIAKDEGSAARELQWMREIQRADQAGGSGRTNRTRYLGATATLALAQPLVDEYRKVQLVEPLQRSLKAKKARLEAALQGYAAAAEYGVADVATAATFQTAELYNDFGKALMSSQRPKKLSKDELEQYNVLLEEQAFPFEEKAIELHEVNARRSASGIYDKWVKDSYAALARLRPARYGKSELGEVAVDAIR
jgi:TolA-binding protein